MTALLFAVALVAQDTVVLKPVVVTATRVPIAIDAATSPVTVVSGATLRAHGLRTVADALRQVAGVAVVETGSYGGLTSVFVRGGESDHVKVLLDGAPLNLPGGAFDFADLTTDHVERIEIVRGPGSVLYGSDAVTGVIQIFTTRGSGAPRATARVLADAAGTSRLSFDARGAIGRVAFAVGASRFDTPGMYTYNSDYRNTVASGRIDAAPDARTELSLSYRYGDDRYEFPTNGAGLPVDSNQVAASRGPTLAVDAVRRLGPAVELRAQGTLREQRMRFSDLPDSPGEDGAFTSRDLIRRAGAGVSATWRATAHTTLTLGAEVEEEGQRGRSLFDASFGRFPDSINVHRRNAAYYGQALLGVGRPGTVNAGVRLDHNSRFGSAATVRAGGSWRLDDGTRLRASFGTGIKEPTFFENFATGFVVGNPSLRPERSSSWEAGIAHTIPGSAVAIAVTYFDQRLRDLIVFDPVGPPNYHNVAAARANGVEVEVDHHARSGLVVAGTYTYLETRVLDGGGDATFTAGRRLIRRPRNAINVQALSPVGPRTTVTLDVRFVGDRDDLDFGAGGARVTLHPFTRVNLGVEHGLLAAGRGRPGLALEGRIENLFADRSREIANFPVRGRVLFLGARITAGGS